MPLSLAEPAKFGSLAVANYLVGRSLSDGPRLTNMSLQKILYFADGKYLAAKKRPLFDSRIEAWEYGPVVPDVYHEFKHFGSRPITEKASTLETRWDNVLKWRWSTPELPIDPETESDRAFLDWIWADYGHSR